MTMRLEQVIQETKGLSANDRALLAHWLISSLETQHDEGVDAAWLSLAEQRLDELETGKVQGVSWEEIKGQLKRTS
ncbi:addiction module protein [Vreelandella neptunia]|uniref:addiction module protein n=1 Tax=Vreelandella neptunia TaxID=115551 RepID=UPI00315A27D6